MQFARIKWIDGAPYSLDFDDIYYAKANGPQESEHVFIAQNQLESRFANLSRTQFTIIETGFGTGLNFFCAAQHWLKLAPAQATLNFISIEKTPLHLLDFIKSSQNWPQFFAISEALILKYPQLHHGLNTVYLMNARIRLDIVVDDIATALPALHTCADAWFLDGFAPNKNSQMWSESVFAQLARLSGPATTFATFTSAGTVRRGLLAAGFHVHKVPGFGKKREMLTGQYAKPSA